MKRKNQIELSKKTIAKAFFALLKKYDLEQITISQITAEAGVARNTFYRNFESIDDILLYSLDDALEQGLNRLSSIENPTPSDLIEWRVRFAKENPYMIYISDQPILSRMFERFTRENHLKLLRLLRPNRSEVDPLAFTYHQGGMQAVLRHWITEGMKRPEQEVVKVIMSNLSNAADSKRF